MLKEIFKSKRTTILILGALLGIFLVIIGSVKQTSDDTSLSPPSQYYSEELVTYTNYVENRVKDIVGEISGISNVSVIVTVESSNENIYAESGMNRDFVIITDGNGKESAVKLFEITAKVRGIAVVCNYGNNDNLKKEIIEMLSSLFSIGSNRISVMQSK